MKIVSLLIVLFLAAEVAIGQTTNLPVITLQPVSRTLPFDALFAQAGALAQAGRIDEAKHLCREILKRAPARTDVTEFLKSLDALEPHVPRQDPAAKLKRKLEAMILPEVNFQNAKFEEVLGYLQKQTGLLSEDKTEVNFVSFLPPEEKVAAVTMSVRNVSMLDAIRYVVGFVKLQCRVEEYAVVISKPEAPAKNRATFDTYDGFSKHTSR